MADLEVLRPERMHVEFALFEGDTVLHRGHLMISPTPTVSCFGQQSTVSGARADGTVLEGQAFTGLIVEHTFGLPAANLSLRYLEVRNDNGKASSGAQVERFKAALQMGIHRSTDWESVSLDQFDFAFRCEPL